MLLRKLWAKMSEPDWRTVSKAVYLFHSILKDLPVEHHAILKIFLGKVNRNARFNKYASVRTTSVPAASTAQETAYHTYLTYDKWFPVQQGAVE